MVPSYAFVIEILSALGLTVKLFAVPAWNVVLEPDNVKVGVRVRLYVFALTLLVSAVLIAMLPLNPPLLITSELAPAVNVCTVLKDDIEAGT